MASPQLQNGFARIANELLEQFLVRDFSKRELVVLLYVVRHTYGFSRKAFALDPKEAAAATGLDAENLRKSIKALLASGVLVASEDGVGLQKDHDLWQAEGRSPVKTTDDGAGQNNRNFRSKQPRNPVKTTDNAGPITPFQAVFQDPKESKKKETPYSPQGDDIDLPFSEPLSPPPDDPDEADQDPAFTAWFDACWALVLKKVNRKPSISAARRIPKKHRQAVLDALEVYNASRDWAKPGELNYYLHFSSFLNKGRWEELRKPEQPPAADNPYTQKPWGPIWTQMGEPPTYYGVMNFCASVAPKANPREAGEVFKTAGFEAAVEYVIERRNAG